MGASLIVFSDGNDAQLNRLEQCGAAGTDSEFAANIGEVKIDRGFGAILDPGDFPGCFSLKKPHQGLYFLIGQLGRWDIPLLTGRRTNQWVERLMH